MSRRLLVATFQHAEDVLGATDQVRREGFRIVDVFTPYPVHGLEKAMGLRPSFLTWVCFVCGLTGAVGMLAFQHWTNAVNWPIDIGGKPWNSMPAEAPVGFEMMVLLAGFGSVFALLATCRLFPGAQAKCIVPGITDDRFVLVVDEDATPLDVPRLKLLLEEYDVVETEEHVVDEETLR